ncbi:MAG: DUF4143 domain-containing protein [Gemmatimonadota bacterium]|nr:DUF4143 domain-containing protein [Gemmatimonadota bacterium]
MRRYLPRTVDLEMRELLGATGCVVIEGVRGCGKTTTAREFAASEVLLDVDEDALHLAEADPAEVLKGPPPRLIDEWQLEPRILTGSAIPADDATRHTGMRRIVRLRLRPMSLHEAGRSSGAISLKRMLAGEPPGAGQHVMPIAEVAELICRGGWPESVDWPLARALRANRGQMDEVARVDIRAVDGVRRDPQRVRLLLRSLARNVGTAVATSKLAADLGGRDNGAMKPHTAADYLNALEGIMVVENQPAWATHLRSRAVLRKRPVRHFVDPSLAVAALGADPSRLLRDFRFLGLLFESLVVRDLRVYAQAADAEVFHYREDGRLEVDAVVQARDGRWAAFEMKLGPKAVEEGARNLLRLAERVDPEVVGPPQALGVIVASGYGYVRPDGVGVIPIGALGP